MKLFQLATATLLLMFTGSAWALNITSITPNTGTTAGGAVNIIIRADAAWASVTAVTFTGLGAATFSAAGSKITITSIPAAVNPGAVTVTITATGGPYTTTFTYVNTQLQVNVKSTINSVVDIAWGPSTVADSSATAQAGKITAYSWVAGSTSSADAATASVSLGSSYRLSDDYLVTIKNNGTGTGSTIQFSATCGNTNSGAWANTIAGAGSNKFKMQGKIGLTGTALTIDTALTGPFKDSGGVNPATIGPGAELQIDLIYFTPTAITTGADTQQTIPVTFTATHT